MLYLFTNSTYCLNELANDLKLDKTFYQSSQVLVWIENFNYCKLGEGK